MRRCGSITARIKPRQHSASSSATMCFGICCGSTRAWSQPSSFIGGMVDRLAPSVGDPKYRPRNLRTAGPLDVRGRQAGLDELGQGLDGDTVQDEQPFRDAVVAIPGEMAK